MQPTLRDLIASCWHRPQDRPGFGDIIAVLKPLVQNTPTPPPPPMANSELVNMQQVQPMQSPMLAAANSGHAQRSLHHQQQQQQQQQQQRHHQPQQQQHSMRMDGRTHSQSGHTILQGQPSLSSRQSHGQAHDPADAAGDKFAEVVRKVMHMASNAKNAVEQHVVDQPPGMHSAPSRIDFQAG